MPIAPAHVRYRLLVEMRRTAKGAAFDVEPVRADDLRDATAELWFGGRLRKGYPDLPLDSVAPVVRPVFQDGSSIRCRGFLLELDDGLGEPVSMVFARDVMEPVAARARTRLVAEGRLAADVVPYYGLRAEAFDEQATGSEGEPQHAVVQKTGDPGAGRGEEGFLAPGVRPLRATEPVGVEHETRALAPLLRRARAVDADAEDTCHVVLFTESALERAERFSRRGGDADPPVESGAVLVGTLCACPDSGEMFCLVRDAVEATSAEQASFSLTFSGSTWAAIGAVLAARRARPGAPPELIVGSAHGHNFLPAGGAPPCEACATAEICGRTTCLPSLDDEIWSRAVFSAQPWQLALLFGLSARSDRVHALYGQQGGVLRRRGYHVLPDDDLDRH